MASLILIFVHFFWPCFLPTFHCPSFVFASLPWIVILSLAKFSLGVTFIYFGSVGFGYHMMPNNRIVAPINGSFGWITEITSGMGGCCCSSRKAHLHGTPVYYYCPPSLEEHESLTSHDGTASTLLGGFLVDLGLDASTPDTYQPPPAPLPYDLILGCSRSTDSDSVGETIIGSSFGTLTTCEELEESDCKAQANSLDFSPRKVEVPNLNELNISVAEEEDECPICLEEYDSENPNTITRCEHHFHLSCILEWMERSNACPICDQEMTFDDTCT
ncbi:hypothetical protein I3843_01G059500 [Carya illinoinensis]|nr:hypothetical protein I3760_01G059300 [Carya illinoinensis]KAG7994487.1 hypothetical protein I3843_01G059500 [Carya illinoinensis]